MEDSRTEAVLGRDAARCPACESYRVRILIDAGGREIPTRCGQCGWRREG